MVRLLVTLRASFFVSERGAAVHSSIQREGPRHLVPTEETFYTNTDINKHMSYVPAAVLKKFQKEEHCCVWWSMGRLVVTLRRRSEGG